MKIDADELEQNDTLRRPLSLFPRRPGERDPDWLTRIGGLVLGGYDFFRQLQQTLWRAFGSVFEPGLAARQVCWRITVRQIFFTAVEALPLVSLAALLIGATLVLQTGLVTARLPSEISGRLLVALVLRESAPLITSVLVAGRTGTAIATELGNMRVNFETLGLASLGINPMRFIVLPRLVACTVSVLVLAVYFGALAIAGGSLVALSLEALSFDALKTGFLEAVTLPDLPLFVVKGIGLGAIIGWISCHFGLSVRGSPTEVPERSSQAVLMSLVTCVIYNTACTAGFYLITGPTTE